MTANERGDTVTANTIAQPTCPACGRDDAIDLDSGDKLCLNCRNEWNPRVAATTTQVAVPPPVLDADDRIDVADILAATSIEDVLAPALTGEELMRDHGMHVVHLPKADDLLGKFVECDQDGRVGLVAATEGDSHIEVEFDTGGRLWLAVHDVTVMPDDYEPTTSEEGNEGDADNAPHVPTIATVASLVLVVGCEAVADDEERSLLNPRIGWLPPPASDIPEVEQGAAYAVATLIRFYGLPKEEIMAMAASLLAGATQRVVEGDEE